MPRFTIHGPTISLTSELEALGMTDAFNDQLANFTGIATSGNLAIQDVWHQAFVDVDESGTVAAAATGVDVCQNCLAIEMPDTITVNRAFFFFIRDVATNTVLFAGRESDPTAD
jgi:serpin B